MNIIARVRNLMRGAFGQWIRRRENRNPAAVYEAAIHERLAQYEALRGAAAGILYMRSKLATELEGASRELSRLREQLNTAVDCNDDAVALTLIGRRDTLRAEVERLTSELEGLTAEADTAKKNLVAFQSEIARLREEKVRMLARLANAQARLRLQQTLNGLSTEADLRALDSVREHINRLVAEVQVGRELEDEGLEQRLGNIREAEAEAAARAQLEELKRSRRRHLVPMILPRAASVS
jgi:phage shock protein A